MAGPLENSRGGVKTERRPLTLYLISGSGQWEGACCHHRSGCSGSEKHCSGSPGGTRETQSRRRVPNSPTPCSSMGPDFRALFPSTVLTKRWPARVKQTPIYWDNKVGCDGFVCVSEPITKVPNAHTIQRKYSLRKWQTPSKGHRSTLPAALTLRYDSARPGLLPAPFGGESK